jgi:4-carboxymuconolactone decarboxylase
MTAETQEGPIRRFRVRPLDPDQVREDLRPLLATIVDNTGCPNVFYTMAHNPGILAKWLPLSSKLMSAGRLSARVREGAILRAAMRAACEYELSVHIGLAMAAGLTTEEVNSVVSGGDLASSLSPLEVACIHAADDLDRDHRVCAATWEVLVAELPPSQLIELLILIGHYTMLAGVLNSAGTEIEPAPSRALPTRVELPDLA